MERISESQAIPARQFVPLGAHADSYEDRLSQDLRWALAEGSSFFEGKGAVQETLRKITKKLSSLGIPYAVVGGMALFSHGLRRFTEDVDILVTHESLKEVHRNLDGLGYVPPFEGSKNLRDAETRVKIEFLVTGAYPGDGKPKPVSFPDPSAVSVEKDGIAYVALPTLIELKLASGMSSADRMKDLSDVLELIKTLDLPENMDVSLNPYVREKYQELWKAARPAKRYIRIWHKTAGSPEQLEQMLRDGVTLSPSSSSDEYDYLVTTDSEVARKYDMHDEAEFLIDGEIAEGSGGGG
ncbi:MAG TPA: hypothetical protein VFE62_01125 [Gemmataceae bacterium]|nr:hypothetical protein [Gemmataceae bacterium]